MIRVFSIDAGRCRMTEPDPETLRFPDQISWIDLHAPTVEEEHAVEALLGIDVPTREEMKEIEASSRVYKEGDAIFMTASIITYAESASPVSDAITFVLTPEALVTVRYAEPQPFRTYAARIERSHGMCASPESALVELLDVIVDRLADIMEAVGTDVESFSRTILAEEDGRGQFYDALRQCGRNGDIISKIRESLMTLSRLTAFAHLSTRLSEHPEPLAMLRTVEQDVNSLKDHVTFLSAKTTFLLDATLGMINIEQNAIIKIFSVVAVMFLPPTLVASVYGMNFHFMPELDWRLGYPIALAAMIGSMIVPYAFFKHKKWL